MSKREAIKHFLPVIEKAKESFNKQLSRLQIVTN